MPAMTSTITVDLTPNNRNNLARPVSTFGILQELKEGYKIFQLDSN